MRKSSKSLFAAVGNNARIYFAENPRLFCQVRNQHSLQRYSAETNKINIILNLLLVVFLWWISPQSIDRRFTGISAFGLKLLKEKNLWINCYRWTRFWLLNVKWTEMWNLSHFTRKSSSRVFGFQMKFGLGRKRCPNFLLVLLANFRLQTLLVNAFYLFIIWVFINYFVFFEFVLIKFKNI